MSWFRKKKRSNTSQVDGLDTEYLIDFRPQFVGGFSNSQGITISGTTDMTSSTITSYVLDTGSTGKQKKDGIPVKPKDVLNELETIPTPFSLIGLDAKIQLCKDKEDLIRDRYADHDNAMVLQWLVNRKKYTKYRTFFTRFQNTTTELIDKLLDKHDLVMKTADKFIPEFPDEAIAIMKIYSKKVKKICGKKPMYYVIANKDQFREIDKKRDPILLVQSPFGLYWQILGAWDEEMLILGEL